MPRYFTHYWQNNRVQNAIEWDWEWDENLLEYTASDLFLERGVHVGDVVYPVTVSYGKLYLVGRLEVAAVCDAAEAEERLGYRPTWKASDYLIPARPTLMKFGLEVPSQVTQTLKFMSGESIVRPRISSPERLDQQTMRGVRELTSESADALDLLLSNEPLPSGSAPLNGDEDEQELELYADYSRREVHDIFAPDKPFTPQRGTWGVHGIVAVPDRPGDYVFFITLGQQQGDHVFDEGITEGGVLSWQSQPRQDLENPQIREFIEHDELTNAIYLFFRTRRGTEYTYLGKLEYLSHDAERENPVYFQWQILDWNPTRDILERIGLTLQPLVNKNPVAISTSENRLRMAPAPPPRTMSTAKSTTTFRAYRAPDYSAMDARNRELGHRGERLVVEHEKHSLVESGRSDLAGMVRHVSAIEGDGAGYDVASFTISGETKYIEVKTTRGPASTSFYMSANEIAFSRTHPDDYYLYRVYSYDEERNSGSYYVVVGNVENAFDLTPTQYRVAPRSQ